MRTTSLPLLGCLLSLTLASPLFADGNSLDLKMSEADLRQNGVFGFPQKDAQVFCDTPDLRFSVWNNEKYLYAQAVLWQDNDSALGKTDDGRAIGDNSDLMLRVNVTGQLTTNVDRTYMLNPWPGMEGLAYQILLSGRASTHIMTSTKGRGAIRYIQTPEGRRIRVDIYLIPVNEISKHVSDQIRLGYYGSSPVPALTVNSCGYDRPGKPYYGFSVPAASFHTYSFQKGAELALDSVPDGRHDASQAAPRHRQPMPKVGSAAPEVAAKDWLNAKKAQSLKSLRGKTVLVEFWATWCGPCLQSIPHLNELQARYADKGFVILSFTEQSREGIEPFLKRTPMQYAIGLESPDTFDAYGIAGIPQAFLVDASGTINWEGGSGDKSLDGAIQTALKH